MSNDLVTMETIKDKINERVKVAFFEMLPDEKFQKLVDDELKAFFEATSEQFSISKTDRDYYTNTYHLTTPISPFRAMVWAEVKKIVADKFKELLSDEEGLFTMMSGQWDNYGNQKLELSENLKGLLKSLTLDMAQNMFSNMFAQMFDSMSAGLNQTIDDKIRNMNNY